MPARSAKLLLDEYPLILLPTLACVFGDRDAIFIQQIHYWLKIFERQGNRRHYHAGMWWVYNPVKSTSDRSDWCKQFPFWSQRTIRRIIDRNTSTPSAPAPLIVGNYNLHAYDRTNWYTLNYSHINDHIEHWQRHQPTIEPLCQIGQMELPNLTQSILPNCPDPPGQPGQIHPDTLDPPIPETTRDQQQETTADEIWRTCLEGLRKFAPSNDCLSILPVALTLDTNQALLTCHNNLAHSALLRNRATINELLAAITGTDINTTIERIQS